MRVLIQACEQCFSLRSCVVVGTGNREPCHQCKKCIHDVPQLKKEGRIIPSGLCFRCRENAKNGGFKQVW